MAPALSLALVALTPFFRAVRTMERALMLRRRRCSDWRARFFADLMLAKVELRDAVCWVEKDANYAVDHRRVNHLAGFIRSRRGARRRGCRHFAITGP